MAFRIRWASPFASKTVTRASARRTRSRRPYRVASANAEAQSKDFGIIATEKGWNLYVCGNGGAKPRHADLLASDIDEETCIKYIDRFLMYYIQTADRLTRTAVWLDKMEGGIQALRDVIVHDSLGICEELEKQMQYLVDTYKCEWKEVVNDPERRKFFKQFVNTDETEPTIEFVKQRDQQRPADWTTHFVPVNELTIRGADGPPSEPVERELHGYRSAKFGTSRTTAAPRSSTAGRRSRCSTSPAAMNGMRRRICVRIAASLSCRAA